MSAPTIPPQIPVALKAPFTPAVSLDDTKIVIDTIKHTLAWQFYGRLLLTLFLLGWAAAMTYYFASVREMDEPLQRAAIFKYQSIHQVWFGEESILMILWRIWAFTLMVALLAPALIKLIKVAKVVTA